MSENHPNQLRQLNEGELDLKLKSLREEMFNLHFRNAVKQLDNPLKIREVRRDIARILTLLHEHRKGIRKLAEHDAAKK
jgi:large subunit ribosomal protein L29